LVEILKKKNKGKKKKLSLLVLFICVTLTNVYAKVCNSHYGYVYCDDVGVCYTRNNKIFKAKICPKPYNQVHRQIFEHGAYCYTCPMPQCELIEHWRRIELDYYMKLNGLYLTPIGWCSERQFSNDQKYPVVDDTAKKTDA